MLTRLLFLLTVILGITIFLTGAWTGSLAPTAPAPEDAFVSQPVPLDADIIGSGTDGRQLLEKAIEKLAPAQAGWLKTKIRQTMSDTGSNFVAEGFLQRGPNHCARLEMNIDTLGKRGRLLFVSDGEVVAQVREMPGSAPVVAVEEMPADSVSRAEFLERNGVGGPVMLLQEFRQHLQNARLQTGIMQGRGLIQIKGELEPTAMSVCARTAIPVCVAYVYLDAQTLWPTRMEWWGVDESNNLRLVLRIEFLDAELNRELSDAECMRLFSYQPN